MEADRSMRQRERNVFMNKKILMTYVVMLVAAVIFCILPATIPFMRNTSTFLYCALVIGWAVSIRRRVLGHNIRRCLIVACVYMLSLFLMRVARFDYFDDSVIMSEVLWYAYYVPMTSIPLWFFFASLNVEPVMPRKRMRALEYTLITINVLMCAIILTNHYNETVFIVHDLDNNDYSYNWLYYVILVWIVVFGIGTVVVLFRKCSLVATRNQIYIPVIFIALGLGLEIWYLVNGGSPKIGDHKIFHLQEAYCFTFITGFESVIQIRLIPANSGLGKLFMQSGLNAEIYDGFGNIILSSKTGAVEPPASDIVIRKESICGGSVIWKDDLSAINKLNQDIEEVTEELEGENDLIIQENEIRAERVRFETKNRLYDSIAMAVREQAKKVYDFLASPIDDDDTSRNDMIRALVLSVYIKRMGNLMILSDDSSEISSEELKLSLNESMEYLKLKGLTCELISDQGVMLPSSFVVASYALFESIIENVIDSIYSCSVILSSGEKFRMSIALDCESLVLSEDWNKRLSYTGSELDIEEEDGTYYIVLTYPAAKEVK